jgi:SNF2 family DNA or RNA helicase
MGLGKTLSIVSLIASTLRSARKFGGGEVSRPDSDDSDSDDEDPDLSPSHFGGAVFGMPDTNSDGGSSVNGGHKRKRLSKKEKHAVQRLEAKHRASRLLTRTRATLLVCPLSTVTNWEDQIKEHWKGEVMVIGGAATPPSEAEFRAAESDVLKVYVYHGTARRADPTYLAQFDIVITTFSTLQTEYSRQLKSATNSQAGSAAPSPAPEDDGCDDEVIEVDEDGVPAIKEGQKLEVETERLQMEKSEKAAKGKRKRGLDDYDLGVAKTGSEVVSPLQAVEWFRVVLDEAQ